MALAWMRNRSTRKPKPEHKRRMGYTWYSLHGNKEILRVPISPGRQTGGGGGGPLVKNIDTVKRVKGDEVCMCVYPDYQNRFEMGPTVPN